MQGKYVFWRVFEKDRGLEKENRFYKNDFLSP